MADSTKLARRIMHRHLLVDGPNSRPKESHRELRVEVVAPGCFNRLHDPDGRCKRVNAKSEKRVGDAAPERLKIGKPIADPASFDTLGRSVRSKDRHTEDHRLRVLKGSLNEPNDVIGGMLSVRIHEKRMREACDQSCFHRDESRTTFAMILWQCEEPQFAVISLEIVGCSRT